MRIETDIVYEIRQKLSEIKSKNDFLDLLNYSMKIRFGKNCKSICMSELNYFSNPNFCKNRYFSFDVSKKSGGVRQINSPTEGLKKILEILNFVFQHCYVSHNSSNGFELNKSIVSNAQLHIKKHYVYNIDLKDFFHSFDRNRVKFVLLKELFNFNVEKEKIAYFIASLCTHPLLIDDGSTKIVLPQGSPTSPTITNILCYTLDRRLNGLAKRFNAVYSRYADDITFSSQYNIYSKASFQIELKRIIQEDQSLTINTKKTRLQKTGYRKEVTGLIVNEKVNVKKRFIKKIRMWIYYWERYGYTRAQQIFINDYQKDKSHRSILHPELSNVIKGKLNFIKMVKGSNDETYLKLKKRIDILRSKNAVFIK